MSERAHQLADRFQQANEELIIFALGLSEAQWKMLCPREGRTVGVVVCHIAEGHALTASVTRAVALGQPLPEGLVMSKEAGDRKNAEQARKNAHCTREETVDLLRRNGSAAAEMVRGLTDEQLERTHFIWGRQGSAADLIDHVMIAHLTGHLAALREWVESARP